MAKVISIAQHKGGVGKTTSAANIGAGLARKGIKTLLIDLDPQADLTTITGAPIEDPNNMYKVLIGKAQIEPILIEENLYIVPSDLDLSGAEVELAGVFSRETILKKKLKAVRKEFDVILIDCPPSLGLLTINAFTASDDILIPLQSQFLAMHGIGKLISVVNLVKDNELNPDLNIAGVFITMFDGRRTLDKDVASVIQEKFKSVVLDTKIRPGIALSEAGYARKNIYDYDGASNGAQDYQNLTNEIIKKVIEG